MNQLVFAVLQAQASEDSSPQDVVAAIDALIEEEGARLAVANMAAAASWLHGCAPGMPLGLLAIMTETRIDPDSITGKTISNELLDVIEGMAGNGGQITPEGSEILDRFSLRPGSRKAVEQLCRVMFAVTSHLQLQLSMHAMGRVDPQQALQDGIDRMRAELERWSD
jgi:hypothetical protein